MQISMERQGLSESMQIIRIMCWELFLGSISVSREKAVGNIFLVRDTFSEVWWVSELHTATLMWV